MCREKQLIRESEARYEADWARYEEEVLDKMREMREAAGLSWEGFGIQAQAQAGGGTPERWQKHYQKWQDLGATHMAIATHNAGATSVNEHLKLFEQYVEAVSA